MSAAALAVGYGVLSALLREPDGETLEALGETGSVEALERAAAALGGAAPAAAARLDRALRSADAESVRAERGRAFGHAVRGPCPPYELEYGGEHFLAKSHRLGDLSAFYRAFGVEIGREAHERADHAAAEAEFLLYLVIKRATAEEEGAAERAAVCRNAERRFLEEHLGWFLPALAARVERREPGGVLDATLALGVEVVRAHAASCGARLGSADLALREVGSEDEETVVTCSAGDPLAAASARGFEV